MNLNFTKDNEILSVSVEGRLDTTTAPQFEKFINENCTDVQSISINCEKLTYISSAGLRVMLATQKKMNGAMKLTNVCELVMEVFEMTGFADILVIE